MQWLFIFLIFNICTEMVWAKLLLNPISNFFILDKVYFFCFNCIIQGFVYYKVNTLTIYYMKPRLTAPSFQKYQAPQEAQPNLITHRLKPKRRDDWQNTSISNYQKSISSTNQLLSSISTKLYPRSISVSTGSQWSGIKTQKIQIRASCFDQIYIPKFGLGNYQGSLNFEQLKRKAFRKKIKNIVSIIACSQYKKLCQENNCAIKQKWKNKLIVEPRELKQAQQLKNFVLNFKQQSIYDIQIDKDVTRSFPNKLLPKPKLTLYHANNQKPSVLQILRTVLKMLTICDNDVGYVQGMNLYTGVIVSHLKQTQLSFLFTKEVMKYGNMRKMYVQNFNEMKELCHHMLHRHIKLLMPDLYDVFIQGSVTIEFFMPFYLSMFACVADYAVMHCIIDQFMTKGFLFLDKLMLSMLCFLKLEFLQSQPLQVACKLGASFIRSKQVPWDQIINLTQAFELN